MLVLEVVRALTGSVLGSVGAIVLWTGLGLLAAGLLLLVLSLAIAGTGESDESGSSADTDAHADADAVADVEVAAPPKRASPRKRASAPASRRQPPDTAPAPRPR